MTSKSLASCLTFSALPIRSGDCASAYGSVSAAENVHYRGRLLLREAKGVEVRIPEDKPKTNDLSL